jgi:VanZ family protein
MYQAKVSAQRPRLRHAVVPVFVAFLVGALHALPGNEIAHASWLDAVQADKVIHLGLFATLAHSMLVGLGKSGMMERGRWFVLVGCILYGLLLEWLQGAFCVGRCADGWDVLADALGVGVAWLTFRWVYRVWPGEG